MKERGRRENELHKMVTLEIVQSLRERARKEYLRWCNVSSGWETRSTNTACIQSTERAEKRLRVSSNNPVLSSRRFDQPRSLHKAVMTKNQRACRLCAHQRAVFLKVDGADPRAAPSVHKPSRLCDYCTVHLCMTHFDEYHDSQI